jgi:hypothetical protein
LAQRAFQVHLLDGKARGANPQTLCVIRMLKHQIIFAEIRKLLTKHFKDGIRELEGGTYLCVGDPGVWIQLDQQELKIGLGLPCRYYHIDEDNFQEAIDYLFNLLTKRIRIVQFIKGSSIFKQKIELELSDSNYEDVGTSMIWLFPYWKKTVEKITFRDPLINAYAIVADIDQIKNYA